MLRRRLVSVLVALLAGVVAGPVSLGAEFPRDQELQQVLDLRASAVRERDREAFLSTVDPEAPDFRKSQVAWFQGMVSVPISEYSLKLAIEEWGEFTRAGDHARSGAPVVLAPVEERFRIEGFDDSPAVGDLFYTFIRRSGGWLVASDSDLEDLGVVGAHQPWEFGPVQVARSEHFLLVAHPEEGAFVPGLLQVAEAALPPVEAVWRRPWARRVPIFVPSGKRELERLLAATFDVENFVAFALSSLDREGREGWELSGERIILNRGNFLSHGQRSRREILTHELLHVATRGSTGPFIATFVEEGLAELATGASGTPLLDEKIRAGSFDRQIPEDFEFVSGAPDEIANAYQESLSAMLFARERFGIEAVNRFYELYGSARSEPGASRYHLDRALREVFGIGREEFESVWASYAASQAMRKAA